MQDNIQRFSIPPSLPFIFGVGSEAIRNKL
jgi:hypothetical protein